MSSENTCWCHLLAGFSDVALLELRSKDDGGLVMIEMRLKIVGCPTCGSIAQSKAEATCRTDQSRMLRASDEDDLGESEVLLPGSGLHLVSQLPDEALLYAGKPNWSLLATLTPQ